jgi:hypothetical protein
MTWKAKTAAEKRQYVLRREVIHHGFKQRLVGHDTHPALDLCDILHSSVQPLLV